MTEIQKFRSDLIRTVRHGRAGPGASDTKKICGEMIRRFEAACGYRGALPSAAAEYWKRRYIDGAGTPAEEPSEESAEKLAAILSFLQADGEETDRLDAEDWRELSQLVECEAESLPIDTLRALMSALLEHHAV